MSVFGGISKISVYICQNPLNCTLKICAFHHVQILSPLKSLVAPYSLHVCVLVTQSCPTLQSHGLQHNRLLCPWNSPGKNTGVGSHSLHQGFFLTQGWNCVQIHLPGPRKKKVD